MAIVKSLAVGKARKSAGNVTFATSRGRVIMREKMTRTAAFNQAQLMQQSSFGQVSRAVRIMRAMWDKTYEPSKYGSSFNNFSKINYDVIKEATLALPTEKITDIAFMDAIIAEFSTKTPPISGYGTLSGVVDNFYRYKEDETGFTVNVILGPSAKKGDVIHGCAINIDNGIMYISNSKVIIDDADLSSGHADLLISSANLSKSLISVGCSRNAQCATTGEMLVYIKK